MGGIFFPSCPRMASIEKGCNGQSLAEIVHSSIQSVTFSNNGNNNVSLTPSHVSVVYVPPLHIPSLLPIFFFYLLRQTTLNSCLLSRQLKKSVNFSFDPPLPHYPSLLRAVLAPCRCCKDVRCAAGRLAVTVWQ